MALGIPDKPQKQQNQLGVPTRPGSPPANLMGQKSSSTPSVPQYSGPPPPNAPTLPPTSGYEAFGNTLQGSAPTTFPGSGSGGGTQPISFNGGHYNPTTAPFGFDMTTPGVGEQFWNNNQNLWFQSPQLDWVDKQLPQFQDPWQGEQTVSGMLGSIGNPGAGQQFWNGVQGQFNSMGQGLSNGYTGPNNAQEAYNSIKGAMPGSLQPQFDSYYDRMKQKVMSDVNSQSAARGAYGSNTALNNSIGAGLDVEAQRAKAATDFALADSANQLNWQNSLGNLGRGADLSGLGIFGSKLQGANYDLNKLGTFGNLAFQSEGMDLDKQKTLRDTAFGLDDQKLERLGAGISTAFNSQQAHRGQLNDAFDAANITQGNRENRTNTLYGQNEDFSNDVLNYFTGNYDQLIGMDDKAQDEAIDSYISQMADQRGWDQQTIERVHRDFKEALQFLKKSGETATTGGAGG